MRTNRSRRLAVRAVALGLAALSALGIATAPSADATTWDAYGGSGDTYVACDDFYDWVKITVAITPERGYTTQTASYRFYIRDRATGTGGWTDWKPARAPHKATSTYFPGNSSLEVYTQYAWNRGGTWIYAGEWAPTYVQVAGASVTRSSFCRV
jgi:hypothetical protein